MGTLVFIICVQVVLHLQPMGTVWQFLLSGSKEQVTSLINTNLTPGAQGPDRLPLETVWCFDVGQMVGFSWRDLFECVLAE